jgi:hypothetical protein
VAWSAQQWYGKESVGLPSPKLTAEDIKGLVAGLQGFTTTLAGADPTDNVKVYAEMGMNVIHQQDDRQSSSDPRVSAPQKLERSRRRRDLVSEKRSESQPHGCRHSSHRSPSSDFGLPR